MTTPVWNPDTGQYELPDHSGGLFGLTDPALMNCVDPAYTLWYYSLPDIAFLVGPLIFGVVTAFLFIWLPFIAGDR